MKTQEQALHAILNYSGSKMGANGIVVCDFCNAIVKNKEKVELLYSVLEDPVSADRHMQDLVKSGHWVVSEDPYTASIWLACRKCSYGKITKPTLGSDEWLLGATVVYSPPKPEVMDLKILDHSPPDKGKKKEFAWYVKG